jgi:hypothetical protein
MCIRNDWIWVDSLSKSITALLEVSSLIVSCSGRYSPFGSRLWLIAVCPACERLLQFGNGFHVGRFQSLDLVIQCLVDSTNIVKMPLTDLQILIQLLIYLRNFLIFTQNEINFSTCLGHLGFNSSCFLPASIPLLVLRPPSLFFSRKLLNFLSNLIF